MKIEQRSKWLILLILNAKLLEAVAFKAPSVSYVSRYHRRGNCFSRYANRVEDSVTIEQEVTTRNSIVIDGTSLGKKLDQCNSKNAANIIIEEALIGDDKAEQDRLYGSIKIPIGATELAISDADLAIQTKIKNSKYGIMDLIELNGDKDADRASLALLCIMVGSTASALIANQSFPGPEILRFLVVWILSFTPLTFVGYGISTPEKLQSLLVSIQRNVFPTYRRRMIQHEAGHFLMGHLLGLPVKGYRTNAIKNAVEFYPLSDRDAGTNRANMLGFDVNKRIESSSEDERQQQQPDKPYFSPDGSGKDVVASQSVFRNKKNYRDNPFLKLPSQNEPTNSWPYRGFDHDTIDKLSVVSLAGVCAEILAFGNAEGGYADMAQLRQLFNSAEPEINDGRDMDNRIRFALGFGMTQLRLHIGALDALATVMENDGSVAECILAIENCSNVRGDDGIMGDYELRRRKAFRSEGVGLVERLLLGEKTADSKEDRVVEGKGGGYQKEKFALTGDDPLYAALALATAFFVWASSGGLSLH